MSDVVESIDHAYVERHGVLARYRARKLQPAEADAFETHYLDCGTCQSQLEEDDALATGLKVAGSEGLLARNAQERGARRWLIPYAVAASLLVVVLTALLVRPAAVESIEPTAQAQIVPLLAMRDGAAPADVIVTLAKQPELVVFVIDAVQPELARYDVTVSDAANRILWSARDLPARQILGSERLAVAIPSAQLTSGPLGLAVIGRAADGTAAHPTTFRLQVSRAAN